MFSMGWGELFLVFIIALVVVGPKDIPKIMRFIGAMTARARNMVQSMQKSWGNYMQLDQLSEQLPEKKIETLDGEEIEKK